MISVIDASRRRLFPSVDARVPNLDSLMHTERNPEWERLTGIDKTSEFYAMCMRRKILGAMRYGLFGAEGKAKYDRIGSILKRLDLYLLDKNKEHLVDIWNIAELEFTEGNHIDVWFWYGDGNTSDYRIQQIKNQAMLFREYAYTQRLVIIAVYACQEYEQGVGILKATDEHDYHTEVAR